MTKFFRILAVLIIALGVTFFSMGMNKTSKFSNKFKKEIFGKYPKDTKFYLYSGVVMIVVGLGVLGGSFYRRRR